MTPPQKRPVDENQVLIGGSVGVLLAAASVIYVPAQLHARYFSESGHWITPASPLSVIPKVLRGQIPWTGVHTLFAVMTVLSITGLILLWIKDRRRRKTRADHIHTKAHLMGNGTEMTRQAAEERAKAGKLASADIVPGFMLGMTVVRPTEIWAGWRDGVCMLAGPGGGKTTAIAVPLIMTAPGSVVVTSNKRDISDIIQKGRSGLGDYWKFDPQHIAGPDFAPWYYNPLTYVTDETRALQLAALFAANDREEGAKADPYFDNEGPALLARLLLAAAVDGRYLTQVFKWLAGASFKEPVKILKDHDFDLAAAAIEGIARMSGTDQGNGVIGTAMKSIRFLDNRSAARWIQPSGPDDDRPQFHPEQFVRATSDTLVSLSKEGNGSFGPITAAMVMAVLDAAEEYAQECGGRMPVPLLGMLDEAANICKIPDLPRKYSFYPGYGIFLVTILQNWSQGVLTWGEHGMSQLWSASTYGIVGAGIKDEKFLGAIVKGIGDYHAPQYSRSRSSGRNASMSTSDSFRETPILSVADLQAMPPGTMVVSAMGARPVMARGVPYFKRKDMAEICDQSRKEFGPQTQVTV